MLNKGKKLHWWLLRNYQISVFSKMLGSNNRTFHCRLNHQVGFNHTGCVRDSDGGMDEWVVWFYVEPFTLHLNRDRGQHLLSPIVLVPVPVPVPDTASVITPLF